MILIVGLGNPTNQYTKTRHNIGFIVVDAYLETIKHTMHENMKWERNKKFNALIAKDEEVVLLKPQTFMNESGQSVAACARAYNIQPENIWVIHDDSDLVLGNMRLAFNHSAAGHKGLESIFNNLKTQKIYRMKVGIRPKESKQKAEQFVLKPFAKKEKEILEGAIHKAIDALSFALVHGPHKAMSIYNRTKENNNEGKNKKKIIRDPS